MSQNPPTKKLSSLHLGTGLGLAALVILSGLATRPAAAATVDGSASVQVELVEREGYQQGVHALVFLQSRYGVPMEGDITLTVNGVLRKVEPVATDSRMILDIPLGPMNLPITACATFGGTFWLGGDNYRSVQAAGCDHVALVSPPGFRSPARPEPGRLTRSPRFDR